MTTKRMPFIYVFSFLLGLGVSGCGSAPHQSAIGAAYLSPVAYDLENPKAWQESLYRQLMADVPPERWSNYKVAFLDDPVICRVTANVKKGLFRRSSEVEYDGEAGFVAIREQGFALRKAAYIVLYVTDAEGRLLATFKKDWTGIVTSPQLFDISVEVYLDTVTTYQSDGDGSYPVVEVVERRHEKATPLLSEMSWATLNRLNETAFEELPAMM